MEKIKYILWTTLFFSLLFFSGCSGESSTASSSSSGKAGSMARFAINGEHLYAINNNEIQIYNVEDEKNIIKQSKKSVNWDIETLFSYKNYIYVGSETGMYIYEKNDLGDLNLKDFTSHVRSCDPVVVANDVAYLTLHTNSRCFRGDTSINQLEVYDVSDPDNVRKILTHEMWEPKGLGVDNNLLFICDGDAGLKVFDINQTQENVTLSSKDVLSDVNCYDVIADQNTLYISQDEDVLLYDYSEFPMKRLSTVKASEL